MDIKTLHACIICALLFLPWFPSTSTIQTFYRMDLNGIKPSASPYNTLKIAEDEMCVGFCLCDSKCVAFDISPIERDSSNISDCKQNDTSADGMRKSLRYCYFYDMLSQFILFSGRTTFYSRFKFSDCSDWWRHDTSLGNGVYPIVLPGNTHVSHIRCKMDKNGGWLVFQHRYNGSVDFQRTWREYKEGFGSPFGEFWLGNEALHQLTMSQPQYVKFIATRFSDETKSSQFKKFRVQSEVESYKLIIGEKTSGPFLWKMNNLSLFTTVDRDNDKNKGNCALLNGGKGGFWFNDNCGKFFPNAVYYYEETVPKNHGIIWRQWTGAIKSLKAVQMLIKPMYP